MIAGILAALALIAYVGFSLGAVDFFMGEEPQLEMQLPLDYSAVVCQGDKCRYYVRSDK